MENIILLWLMLLTICAIALTCEALSIKPYKEIRNRLAGIRKRKLYICADVECSQGLEYCCKSCAQNKDCKSVCEDYNDDCLWRVENEG